MPLEAPARIVQELTARGFNAEREAVTLIAGSDDPAATLDAVVDAAPDDALVIEAALVESVLADGVLPDRQAADQSANSTDGQPTHSVDSQTDPATDGQPTREEETASAHRTGENPPVSTGTTVGNSNDSGQGAPVETRGVSGAERAPPEQRSLEIRGDMTGDSVGTGEYGDFVKLFRDRYERLSGQLRSRVNHRPTESLRAAGGGGEGALIGLVDDVRSTANGHWIFDLEDTSGTFPCLITKDRDVADLVDELLLDEVVAVEGTLSDDGGILFVDAVHFPDVPRTYRPSTADRHVQAALISDVHVGSQEFMAEAWNRFADWLHTEDASTIEYLLIAGDMVEGVGVYPDQDEELEIVDIYEQYETFAEHLKAVPGDIEIVMIPGNHDAVRLAEPQPGFDEELRDIMSAHDARIASNPSTVEIEGVSVLMYHGVSLDELIAEFPDEKASYKEPQKPMYHLLKKRHVAPQYGGHMRLAPEPEDHLVIDEIPDVFHTGHVHKLGFGKYHNVLAINSGCWQAQTDFQKSVNIDPDAGFAPVVDLDTLEVTVRKFV